MPEQIQNVSDVVSNSLLSNSSLTTKASSAAAQKNAKNLYSTKSSDQRKILIRKYKENPKWTKEMIEQIADEIGLESIKVYKWVWDRREYRLKKIDKLRKLAKLKGEPLPADLCEDMSEDKASRDIFMVTKVDRKASH